MDGVTWAEIVNLAVYLFWAPVITVGGIAAGAMILLGLADLLMYVVYRVLIRMRIIV